MGGWSVAGEGKGCYGKMFPSVITRPNNLTMATDRSVASRHESWLRCVACEGHGTCYRLSVGRLLLETALSV